MSTIVKTELWKRFWSDVRAALLDQYAGLQVTENFFYSAYPMFAPDDMSTEFAPDDDGDFVHAFGECLALSDPFPIGVYINASVLPDDAVRLLRKMADKIESEGIESRVNADASPHHNVH